MENKPPVVTQPVQPLNQPPPQKQLMHPMTSQNLLNPLTLIILLVFIFLGVGSGFALSKTIKNPVNNSAVTTSDSGEISGLKKGDIFGSADEKTFKDSAEGKLVEGGIEGEGEYHLERSGGESQNVYLTSSALDLSQFVGKKVKVWGQTNAAKRAGWLMDVGRLQLLE